MYKFNGLSTLVFTAAPPKEASEVLAWYVAQSLELQEAFLFVMNTFVKD